MGKGPTGRTGTPGRTRTCGQPLRRRLLYPLSYWGGRANAAARSIAGLARLGPLPKVRSTLSPSSGRRPAPPPAASRVREGTGAGERPRPAMQSRPGRPLGPRDEGGGEGGPGQQGERHEEEHEHDLERRLPVAVSSARPIHDPSLLPRRDRAAAAPRVVRAAGGTCPVPPAARVLPWSDFGTARPPPHRYNYLISAA